MCVDTHVTSCAAQTLALAVWDVLLGLWVTVLLRHTEIDHMHDICSLGHWPADQEVVGLDVPVDQVLLVDRLHSSDLQNVGSGDDITAQCSSQRNAALTRHRSVQSQLPS